MKYIFINGELFVFEGLPKQVRKPFPYEIKAAAGLDIPQVKGQWKEKPLGWTVGAEGRTQPPPDNEGKVFQEYSSFKCGLLDWGIFIFTQIITPEEVRTLYTQSDHKDMFLLLFGTSSFGVQIQETLINMYNFLTK